MKRSILAACTVAALAVALAGCTVSPEQQREDVALVFARTLTEKTPGRVCDDHAGDALLDREGWEDVEVESSVIEPTSAGEYIIGLQYTKDGDEKHARVWLASDGDEGYCVRIAADGVDDR